MAFLLVFTVCCSLPVVAQIGAANRLFEQYKYSQAAERYLKAFDSKDIEIQKNVASRLGDCYRFMNDMEKARKWYAKAVSYAGTDPENYYYLGIALRTLKQYDEAKENFQRYSSLVPDDTRGKTYAGYCEHIDEWDNMMSQVEIRNVAELNTEYSEFSPEFYQDGIVFASDRDFDRVDDRKYLWTNNGYLDLYASTPEYYNDFWSEMDEPEALSASFNQMYHDGPISISEDGSIAVITRTIAEKSAKGSDGIHTDVLKLFYKENIQSEADFIPFPYNSSEYSVGHPALSPDGSQMIFSSNMPGGEGESDLYLTDFIDGTWSEPVSLGTVINTFGNEVFPFWANETTLYFASDGHMGYGGLDVFQSTFINGEWTKPTNLMQPINSSYDDFGIVFSKNGTSGFFSSNRPGGKGSDDIYAFKNYGEVYDSVVEFTDNKVLISGFVKDESTLEPLEDATVFIYNTTEGKVRITKTNASGYYEAEANEDDLYVVKAMMSEYFDDCLNFRVEEDDLFTADNVSMYEAPRDLLLWKYEIDQVFKVENIYYDLDKWNIRDDAKPHLDELVRLLKQYPITIELGSHTDSRASDEYNEELSQKRAESVVRYLVLKGINSARLTAKGYGETMLVNRCADGVECTEEEHQANRRTEFKITGVSEQEEGSQFDLSIFEDGDEMSIKLFPDDFFADCFDK